MARTNNGNLVGRAAAVEKSDVLNYVRLEEEKERERRRQTERAETLQVCDEIASRLSRADYLAWWETTPDDNAGFLKAAKRKLSNLKLREIMDDPSASALEQSEAVDLWMKENWEDVPEVEL